MGRKREGKTPKVEQPEAIRKMNAITEMVKKIIECYEKNGKLNFLQVISFHSDHLDKERCL